MRKQVEVSLGEAIHTISKRFKDMISDAWKKT